MKYKLLIIILCFIITGCYNYRELNDLAIISAIGISKDEDNIKLTIQVLDTNDSNTSDGQAKYVLFNSTGKTIQEALKTVMNESSKRLYINHMQVLIIDEDISKDGINNIIDFFFRNPESRKQYYVLITNNNIEEVLSNKTLLEKINGKNIRERIEKNSIFLNDINKLTFTDLIIDYLNPNKELVISSIELNNNKLLLNNSGIFKDDKLIGYIDKQDIIYYNFILDKIDNTLLTFKINDNYISIEVISNKTDIKVKNNNININFNINATINDINNSINTNNHNLKDVENKIQDKFNNEVYNSISNIINKYNIDIYGFKDLIYKNDYQNYNPFINLKDLNIKINSKIKLTHKGNGDDNINEKN